MSVENGKVCCNCRHNIRTEDKFGGGTFCHCDINKLYMGYGTVMTGWCRHWAKDKEVKNEDNN